jgi:hypothetical protein
MQRIMEPTLAALRVMLADGRTDPDPALRPPPARWPSGPRRPPVPSPSTGPWACCGSPWGWPGCAAGRSAARHALRLADRQLAAGNLTGLQARARAWRALAEAWYGDLTAARRSAADVLTRRGPLESVQLGGG